MSKDKTSNLNVQLAKKSENSPIWSFVFQHFEFWFLRPLFRILSCHRCSVVELLPRYTLRGQLSVFKSAKSAIANQLLDPYKYIITYEYFEITLSLYVEYQKINSDFLLWKGSCSKLLHMCAFISSFSFFFFPN